MATSHKAYIIITCHKSNVLSDIISASDDGKYDGWLPKYGREKKNWLFSPIDNSSAVVLEAHNVDF